MRPAIFCLTLSVLAGSCASKSPPAVPLQEAFRAGEQHALARVYEAQHPTVRVLGFVRHPLLDWTEDLTLARAIVAAEYLGIGDPREIIIRRGAEEIRVSPQQLLQGEDWPLAPGDVVEIRP